jgi:hypothetical protein
MRIDSAAITPTKAMSATSMPMPLGLLDDINALMDAHPIDRLDRWTDFARAWGETPGEKDYFAQLATGETFDVKAWEENWIKTPGHVAPVRKVGIRLGNASDGSTRGEDRDARL